MAGIIKREDIDAIRAKIPIEQVIGQHVMLKTAGMGSLKGLCPFHDEKTPSFHVRPAQGYYHCFGCGESGDVYNFVQNFHHLDFVEAVEYLADQIGYRLEKEEPGRGGKQTPSGPPKITRQRLLDANRTAQHFFQQQLATPAAQPARDFLLQRGFTPENAQQFQLGYAPNSWDTLLKHLRKRGFTENELAVSGLFTTGQKGIYDRFRGRLIWPIHDLTGATIGFGARRLSDEDTGPKYLNTPETAVYKKSQVLYGIDRAKKSITQNRRLVLVEGYTDVMAMHLSGIDCAVATCGTAFGEGHVRIARRLLGDSADPAAGVIFTNGKTHGAEVIFIFDGDEAGQKAALRAFQEDQNFSAQTFVAVEKHGLDPCDLWQQQGSTALTELVNSRTPLFEFVLRSILAGHNLDLPEGRVAALHQSLPIISQVKDLALRSEYVRLLAGWIGLDENTVKQELQRWGKNNRVGTEKPPSPPVPEINLDPQLLTSRDYHIRLQRQALQALLQYPAELVGVNLEEYSDQAFTPAPFAELFHTIRAQGGWTPFITAWQTAEQQLGVGYPAIAQATQQWLENLLEKLSPAGAKLLRALVVAPLPQDDPQKNRVYVQELWRNLRIADLDQEIHHRRTQLQRATHQPEQQKELFTQLIQLENRRRQLKESSE